MDPDIGSKNKHIKCKKDGSMGTLSKMGELKGWNTEEFLRTIWRQLRPIKTVPSPTFTFRERHY